MAYYSKPKQITSWSWSRLQKYRGCPYAAKLAFIDKIKEPGNDAMARGNDIHKETENFLKNPRTRVLRTFDNALGKEFVKNVRKSISKLPESDYGIEDTWAFTKDWQKTTYDDWTGCVLRIKTDLWYIVDRCLYVIDWKSGRYKEEDIKVYLEQLELYAFGGFMMLGDRIDEVMPCLYFLDHGINHPSEMLYKKKEHLPMLKKKWTEAPKQMLSDKRFDPTPGDACKWCFYKQKNITKGGGQCKY